MKRTTQTALGILGVLLLNAAASAHVIVTPGQAGVGQELVFSVSVPNERNTPVTDVKLLVPSGVTSLVPTEKAGWVVGTQQDRGGTISSVEWSGGSIPIGQRDDFSFSAQVPGSATDLAWRAYQTYGDGTVVHWDQKPSGSDDSVGTAGPYSVTHVVNDLRPSGGISPNTESNIALGLGLMALLLAGAAYARRH